MEVEQKESKIKTYREVAKYGWGLGKKKFRRKTYYELKLQTMERKETFIKIKD